MPKITPIRRLATALIAVGALTAGCTAADAGSSTTTPTFPSHDGWTGTRALALRDGLTNGSNAFTMTQANCAATIATSKWSYAEFYNLDSDTVAAAITGCLG